MAITAALISGGAMLGSAGIGALGRSGASPAADYSLVNIQQQRDLLNAQLAQQALANQRAVAGTQDQWGGGMQYDPATNTWRQTEGALPKQSDIAAFNAGITRNTTDLQQQELVNRMAMQRATQAGPTADTALRNLDQFRPMRADELAGLLTQQATSAARATYDPLRSDTLRAVARTGTAAAPVLAELGRSEANNLRDSLRSALIDSMTQTGQINQQRQAGLENAAANASSLATPNLGQTGLADPRTSTLGQLAMQRALYAAGSTPKGDPTGAGKELNSAYAGAKFNDPNFGVNQAVSGLKDIGTFFGSQSGKDVAGRISDYITGGPGTTDQWLADYNKYAAAQPGQTGDWWNTGVPQQNTYQTATGWTD